MAKSMGNGNEKKGATIILLVLAGLIVWTWRAYGERLKSPERDVAADIKEPSEPTVADIATVAHTGNGLLEVRIPQSINAKLLHYPGFTVSFNPDTHQPNYVAWELTGEEARSQKTSRRSISFSPDPDVTGCATLNDYRGSGYDRGHMAPAGDMTWDSTAMQASFLLTNISPQAHELNQGSWRALEEKCRDWAIRDSAVVIVCGPVFSGNTTLSIGETAVAVPDRYFKVVLAPYVNPPRAIGFVMPNGNVSGGMQACSMPVDDVEAITGFDFFHVLPDDVEEQIESECNFPRWSKRK